MCPYSNKQLICRTNQAKSGPVVGITFRLFVFCTVSASLHVFFYMWCHFSKCYWFLFLFKLCLFICTAVYRRLKPTSQFLVIKWLEYKLLIILQLNVPLDKYLFTLNYICLHCSMLFELVCCVIDVSMLCSWFYIIDSIHSTSMCLDISLASDIKSQKVMHRIRHETRTHTKNKKSPVTFDSNRFLTPPYDVAHLSAEHAEERKNEERETLQL